MSDIYAGKGPNSPHLALLVGLPDEYCAIPVGAVLQLVGDSSKPEQIFRLVLTEVRQDELRFRCGCGIDGCDSRIKYTMTWKGSPPHNKAQRANGKL